MEFIPPHTLDISLSRITFFMKDMTFKQVLRSISLASLSILFMVKAQGQLVVDINMPPTQIIQNLVGPGVEITNLVVTAADSSYGYYYSTGTEIGTSQGLLLTTGKASYAIGPNNSIGNCSSSGLPGFNPCHLFDNGFPGDLLLNAEQDRVTRDACIFEFDIKPQGDSLKFKYTFGSDEYSEWINSPFKDVFGFYISGPNVGTNVNLAVLPTTNQIVSIPTVNLINNSEFFYNNENPYGQQIQYDGFTINLQAVVGNLIPCETYHLKLVIADGQDRVYDSGVFINAIESNPVVVLTATSNGLDYMVEGCNTGTITFSRTETTNAPQTVTYWIGGSAIDGVDYNPELGTGVPLEPTTITIPSGEQTVTIEINAIQDNILEGQEFLTIYLGNPLCSETTLLDSVNFFIFDFLEVAVNPDDASICVGQCIELTGSGISEQVGTFEWTGGTVSDPSSLLVEVCPIETTTYTFTSTVGECSASDSIEILVSSISVALEGTEVNCQGMNTGTITSTVLNALSPFNYEWTGPDGFTSNDADLFDLAPGEYCVTVIDGSECVATACITLIQTDILSATGEISDFTCNAISCAGACDGTIALDVTGGVEPFSFTWSGPSNYSSGNEDIVDLCAGTYTVEIIDGAGCMITRTFTLIEPTQVVIEVVGTVDLLCTGVETGQASVNSNGGCAPYVYSWSHDASVTGPVATNLGSGEYSVSVTDQNGCTSGGSVTIFINDPIDPLLVVVDDVSFYPGGFNTSCPASTDGFVNITITGGSPDYSVEWRSVSDNTLFLAAEDLADAPCGDYELTVTDANGCEYTQSVTLTCVPAIGITQEITPNPCGAPEAGNGTIDITNTFGGNGGPYSYEWNGPSCAPCLTEDIAALNSGDYIVNITDAQGCTTSLTLNVGQNDLFTAIGVTTDNTCFESCNGAIDITINPAGTYDFLWSGPEVNGTTTEDLQDLCAGVYSVAISALTCEETFTFEITQPTEIIIEETNVINPLCFGQNNGSIDIIVINGSGDYTYEWLPNPGCFFSGSATQNIANLFDCAYTVNVTDNVTLCTATRIITLESPQVMQIIIEPSEYSGGYNTSCSNENDGQIQVFIVGGTPDCTQFAPYCYNFDWTIACSTEDPADYGNDPNADLISNLPGGTYGINVTDANGCLATTCVDMIPPPPIESAPVIDNITCDELTGSISPNVTGGSEIFTIYTWTGNIGNNAPNAAILTDLVAGDYSLTVQDANGCIETFNYTITQSTSPEITLVSSQNVSCNGNCNGSYTFDVNGGVSPYSITINNNPIVIFTYPATFDNLCAGEYVVVVTDANNDCSAEITVTITEPQAIAASLEIILQEAGQIFSLQCFGDQNGSINATVSGGQGTLEYVWTNLANTVIGNSEDINNLSAGVYCLTITDEGGCSIEECIAITQSPEPLTAISSLSIYNVLYNVSCNNATNGSINVTVSGGVGPYTYLWLGDGTMPDIEDQTNLGAGIYDLVVVDANFCTLSLQFELVEPIQISIGSVLSSFDGNFNISCNGNCDGAIDLNLSGGIPGYTVIWSGPNGYSSTSEDIANLCAGDYIITVTDATNCTNSQAFEIAEPDVLVASISSNLNCETGNIDLCASATGGSGLYSYNWSTGESSFCIIVDETGQTCVTATDSNGCTNTICVQSNVFPALELTGSTTNASCGLCNGVIDISISGGFPPYDINWTGSGIVQGVTDQTGLCEGTYTVLITDGNECSRSLTFNITQNLPVDLITSVQNVRCFEDSTGSITAAAVGAVEPITYEWFNNNEESRGTGSTITGLPSGSYTVVWTDAAGCSASGPAVVGQASALEIEFALSDYDGVNISVPAGADGFIQVYISGGTPAYTYQWSPIQVADTTTRPTGLAEGVYDLSIIDANGCKLDTSFTLIDPDELALPTGLSPNGDGFNDTYVIRGVLRNPKNTFKVFNRWGNLVYERSNYANEWFGQTSDGESLADGTYFVIFETGSKEFNTYVDLRRN